MIILSSKFQFSSSKFRYFFLQFFVKILGFNLRNFADFFLYFANFLAGPKFLFRNFFRWFLVFFVNFLNFFKDLLGFVYVLVLIFEKFLIFFRTLLFGFLFEFLGLKFCSRNLLFALKFVEIFGSIIWTDQRFLCLIFQCLGIFLLKFFKSLRIFLAIFLTAVLIPWFFLIFHLIFLLIFGKVKIGVRELLPLYFFLLYWIFYIKK